MTDTAETEPVLEESVRGLSLPALVHRLNRLAEDVRWCTSAERAAILREAAWRLEENGQGRGMRMKRYKVTLVTRTTVTVEAEDEADAADAAPWQGPTHLPIGAWEAESVEADLVAEEV